MPAERLLVRATDFVATLIAASALAACAQGPVPSFRQPARLFDVAEEQDYVKRLLAHPDSVAITKEQRNSEIALRMYAVDLNYTRYEAQLTHETQGINLASTVVNLGLTGAASVIPAGQTTKVLSAIATGLTGASAAYDKEVLLAHSIQNVQTQMRANRSDVAARIFANMRCPVRVYPMGMALSDLEAYYRAGTMTGGLVGVANTVNRAEYDARAKKDSASPALQVREPRQ